jgi:hypothetical protein
MHNRLPQLDSWRGISILLVLEPTSSPSARGAQPERRHRRGGIMPGCLCEGWGASLGATTGWSANSNGGDNNVSLVSFVSTAATATSVVTVGSSLTVTQAYGLSASNALVRNHVTLTNTSAVADTVRYSRSMDWDIPPTEFNENVTIGGVGATRLIFSNDNGFATPNPLVHPGEWTPGTTNVNFTDNGPADHGAFFTFRLRHAGRRRVGLVRHLLRRRRLRSGCLRCTRCGGRRGLFAGPEQPHRHDRRHPGHLRLRLCRCRWHAGGLRGPGTNPRRTR